MTSATTEDNQTPAFAASHDAIDQFCDALWLEHGLAKNSLEAYRRDLKLFAEWLGKTRGASLDTATEVDLTAYAALRSGDKATSANRRLSVFRRYYAWGLREHRVATDPTLKLRSAKQAPRFPRRSTKRKWKRCSARRTSTRRSDCATARCSN